MKVSEGDSGTVGMNAETMPEQGGREVVDGEGVLLGKAAAQTVMAGKTKWWPPVTPVHTCAFVPPRYPTHASTQ